MSHSHPGVLAPRMLDGRVRWRPLLVAALLAVFLEGPCLAAGLSYAEAIELARQTAPALRAGDAAVAAAAAARPAAATLPDPRLVAGVENLPISGPDRWSATRDSGTMQRLALMQEVPNSAKREARLRLADARIERERAARRVMALTIKREAAQAWLGVYHAERRLALVAELRRENRLLQDTLPARIASGRSMPADLTMARQEALAIADREDELVRDLRRAKAELRRWVGARSDDALVGPPALDVVVPQTVRDGLHRHAELLAYEPMRGIAYAEIAEADAERRGDWAWEVAYSRRPRYGDMVSLQFSFDLPWQVGKRQQPAIEARRQDALRVEAEREEVLRRRTAEVETMLAEAATLETQLARLQGAGVALSDERVRLATSSYQAGRSDLGAVLAARAQSVDLRLRAIELEAQRDSLRVRLTTLVAE